MQVVESVPLSLYTTLKVGGEAKYFVEVLDVEELKMAVTFARAKSLPFLVIGGGSNILFPDTGYAGLIIKVAIMGKEYQRGGGETATMVDLYVGAGEVLNDLVRETTEKQYWGLENFTSIPGTVGATPVQNVGAYGSEVSDVIYAVEVYDTVTGELKWLTNAECQFGYRDSFFKTLPGAKLIITRIHFKLSVEPILRFRYEGKGFDFAGRHHDPKVISEFVRDIRAGKFPDWQKVGTAGSFFKNPYIDIKEAEALQAKYPLLPVFPVSDNIVKISLGYVLDKICNLRGFRHGHVGLSEAQALVLINHGGATATDIIQFAEHISDKVFATTKIKIEPEVRIIESEK